MPSYVIAANESQELVCDTGAVDYVPDPVRHNYGVSTRRPLEDWFLTELEFVRGKFPKHEIFTLGASLVFGEKFITYLTVCELEIKPGTFEELRRAVRESDQAIRRKVGAMWKWDACLIGTDDPSHAALFIGWMDFVYFLQHKKQFMDVSHNRFMAAFATGKSRSTDYKVLHDGTLVEFDPNKLSESDRKAFDRASEIKFEVVNRARPETHTDLDMV